MERCLDVRVQDTEKPDSSAAMSFSGAESNLPELAAKVGAEIRKRLGVRSLSPVEEVTVRSSLPSDPVARRKYAEGVDKLQTFDPAGARALIEQVVALEPNFAGGHMQLSTALLQTGYDLRARNEAKKAKDLSGQLPRNERLVIEARYWETAGQWDKAVEIYTSLWTFYPDDPEYGIALLRVQTRAGSAHRRIEPWLNSEPQLHPARGRAANRRAPFRRPGTSGFGTGL